VPPQATAIPSVVGVAPPKPRRARLQTPSGPPASDRLLEYAPASDKPRASSPAAVVPYEPPTTVMGDENPYDVRAAPPRPHRALFAPRPPCHAMTCRLINLIQTTPFPPHSPFLPPSSPRLSPFLLFPLFPPPLTVPGYSSTSSRTPTSFCMMSQVISPVRGSRRLAHAHDPSYETIPSVRAGAIAPGQLQGQDAPPKVGAGEVGTTSVPACARETFSARSPLRRLPSFLFSHTAWYHLDSLWITRGTMQVHRRSLHSVQWRPW